MPEIPLIYGGKKLGPVPSYLGKKASRIQAFLLQAPTSRPPWG
jgi:hypothetical protein